ncbi:MAG: hypothetical protein ACI4P3_04840 [Candidatus Spyradosoma sp.]
MNRGGSWNNPVRNCRSANRDYNSPGNRNNDLGFRVCAAQKSTDIGVLEQSRAPFPARG